MSHSPLSERFDRAQRMLETGDARGAMGEWLECLALARAQGHRQGEGAVLGNLGLAYRSLGEYHKAIEYQERALKISEEIGDRQGQGIRLGNLGIAYRSLGEYRKAIEYRERALKICVEIGDRRRGGSSATSAMRTKAWGSTARPSSTMSGR